MTSWSRRFSRNLSRLARRRDLADRLVGIAGDFVPARTALNARFLWDLLSA